MRPGPLTFCWIELGEGKVCERLADHDGECSPDPATDFPTRFDPPATWDCPHCDWPPSYNPNDIANRYCGHCHHYCEEV